MLNRLVDTGRCMECGAVFTFSGFTRLLDGVRFALMLGFVLYYVQTDKFFGIAKSEENDLYIFGAAIVVLGLLGTIPVAALARLDGPVPAPVCAKCGEELTGTAGFRCYYCGKKLPRALHPFVDKLWTLLLPAFVASIVLFLYWQEF